MSHSAGAEGGMSHTQPNSTVVAPKGLEGVVAAESSICLIDGQKGKLLYRGYNIHDLAEYSTFEETAFLLWEGELPTAEQLRAVSTALQEARDIPTDVLDLLRRQPPQVPPIATLRTAVSALAAYDPEAEDESPEANRRKAVRLTAKVATLVAAIHRIRLGLPVVNPSRELSHAANFFFMLNGREPDATESRAMDLVFVLHAEHGFNASTFTARVIASTLSDMYSAVTGAIGALKGPLHGGAAPRVVVMLEEIGEPSRAEAYIKERLERREKIMGFGHRVYKVEDPRATHLREWAKELAERSGKRQLYEIALEVENIMKQEKQLACNVDYYAAVVEASLGIPQELFTCVFAASRMAGWTAHVLEQQSDNRIIRPTSAYTGPAERRYVPLDKRASGRAS
jgi:citrate synthase